MVSKFSTWKKWSARESYEGILYPGIYVIAISPRNLSDQEFTYCDEIVYVGMTNAVAGLKGRLKQFDNTIGQSHRQHGGADRLLFVHQNYDRLVRKLYVSMRHWECVPARMEAADLFAMGAIAQAEYETLAECLKNRPCGEIPKFNDKKNSPKFSRQ